MSQGTESRRPVRVFDVDVCHVTTAQRLQADLLVVVVFIVAAAILAAILIVIVIHITTAPSICPATTIAEFAASDRVD